MNIEFKNDAQQHQGYAFLADLVRYGRADEYLYAIIKYLEGDTDGGPGFIPLDCATAYNGEVCWIIRAGSPVPDARDRVRWMADYHKRNGALSSLCFVSDKMKIAGNGFERELFFIIH